MSPPYPGIKLASGSALIFLLGGNLHGADAEWLQGCGGRNVQPDAHYIIHTISHKLQFQIKVISHHNICLFGEYADRYRHPAPDSGREGGASGGIEVLE